MFASLTVCFRPPDLYARWQRSSKPQDSPALPCVPTPPSPLPKRKGSSFSSPDEYAYDPYGATYSSEVARPYGIDTEIHPMSPTTYQVIKEWEHAQVVERSAHIYAKKPPPPGSPSTSTLPVYNSEGHSVYSYTASARSMRAPSTSTAAPSVVNDMGVDTARYSTCAEGPSRLSMDSIEISDSRPGSPAQFSDDFQPQAPLPSFPQPPPYDAPRPSSTLFYSNTNAPPLPPSSLHVPARTPLRHAASTPESLMGVRVTIDTIREIV